MSRDLVDNCGPILAAAERWKERALLQDGSVFTDRALWTVRGMEGLERFFVDNLDEGEGNFIGKLEGQLAPSDAAVKQLAAELTWVMLLCPSNTLPPKKRETVGLIWGWSGEPIPQSADPWLTDAVLDGLGSAGTAYNTQRWRELVFAIRFGLAFKQLDQGGRQRLLADPWVFGEWLSKFPDADVRQLRHMLLYLLFPDTFERIFGGGDRRLIVSKFRGLSVSQVSALSAFQIDRELDAIRAEAQIAHPTEKLDFYFPPLEAEWRATGFDKFTADVSAEHVREALKEIDEKGIPASAVSTTYDLIEDARRYPPKYVLSLAAKHASGKEFDRTLFSGGVDSPAFKLLRSLGFQIERKDFLREMMRKFLAQASEARSQATRGYPDEYRGLSVEVSFGFGAFANVPWIGFLGHGQTTRKGISPVYLYYRAEQLLILAKGISETEAPDKSWPTEPGQQTVDQYFVGHLGHRPDKYKNSIVYQVYKVPDGIDEQKMDKDLDLLIAKYQTLLAGSDFAAKDEKVSDTSTKGPKTTRKAEAPEAAPYTVKEATQALFISQERFEEILDVWREKKNLVVQGPPGVGKTFFYRQLAFALMGFKAPDRMTSVQFHPSYAYEDFIQGYRPSNNGFVLRDGVFFRFCEKARVDKSNKYVFVIDEINRGNLAKIFGELLMLLEKDKRGAEWGVPLAYSLPESPGFYIPENLYVLGLMNTADRSLAVVDYALRRRFAFASLQPEFKSLRFLEHLGERSVSDALADRIVGRMTELNDEIAKDKVNLGPGYRIGHSFFCDPPVEPQKHEDWFVRVVQTEIAPLLDEYYFDDPERAQLLVQRLLKQI